MQGFGFAGNGSTEVSMVARAVSLVACECGNLFRADRGCRRCSSQQTVVARPAAGDMIPVAASVREAVLV